VARDYYSVLVHATSVLDPNTAESRQAVYDRARRALAGARLGIEELTNEQFALEVAIQRSEADFVDESRGVSPTQDAIDQASNGVVEVLGRATVRSSRPRRTLAALLMLGLAAAAILALGIVGLQYWPRATASRHDAPKTAPAPASNGERTTSASEETSLSYNLRRQLVYYRSIQPVGTIVIVKSQHFLYLTLPNTVAVRYAIGVGRDCANVVGLLLVSAKEDWTDPNAPAPTSGVQPDAKNLNRGVDGRLGARSLALGDTGRRIHGTSDPRITDATGCFPLVNDDMINLYNRVALGARVVMN
jgi:lipoprotein-anchoring transpeptidase ErfK/SrfK